MNETAHKLTKIGVFYDGNYFLHVSNYYNYSHARRSRISIGGLHSFIRNHVAHLEGVDQMYCQVVDMHYFRGRLLAHEAQHRNKLLTERVFDDILMREGVVTHYLPLSHSTNGNLSRWGEKGIDVWLALEAYEATLFKKFNVFVLIACDGDYIPLVRKLNSLGTRVMVLGWDFEYTDHFGQPKSTTTSIELLDEVSYPVLMHNIIDDKTKRADPIINNLFVPKDQEYEALHIINPDNNHKDENNGDNNLHQSKIHSLKDGYGFVETETTGKNLFFYWDDVLGSFNDLKPGDMVEYKIGSNAKGECAKEVRKAKNVPI